MQECFFNRDCNLNLPSLSKNPVYDFKFVFLDIFMSISKGQLISKCPFGVIVWNKIPEKKFENFCPRN